MLIETNGVKIHCELSGKPDAPVVVLSHSLASSMVMWAPQLAMLEPHFRVLRYDMRGLRLARRDLHQLELQRARE